MKEHSSRNENEGKKRAVQMSTDGQRVFPGGGSRKDKGHGAEAGMFGEERRESGKQHHV